MNWAQRLKRVFKLDLQSCEGCDGQVRVIACIEDRMVIGRILQHLERNGPVLAGGCPRHGTTHVIFQPLDCMAGLAALVPKPRVHRTCRQPARISTPPASAFLDRLAQQVFDLAVDAA